MILCCGEALIDMLPRTATDGGDAFQPHAGGAVFNTAIALGRLGAKAGFFSGISTDLFGEILADGLAASQVSTDLVVRRDHPTTLAFVTLTDGQARYAFYDENTAGRLLQTADLPELTDSVSSLFFGGISLIVEPCATAYEALMAREADARVTMIDPNVRPSFIRDEAHYRRRINRMMAMADIVKLSDEDLQWLAGPGDVSRVARGLLSARTRLVLITEGARGARAVTADHDIFQPAETVTVVDTVGAGDTFNAGALAGLDRAGALNKSALGSLTPETLNQALNLGVRAAAVTVSRAGANPPWANEV